jgi:ceramide glucosyltransferase
MEHLLLVLQALTLIPVVAGSVYGVLCLVAVCIFARRMRAHGDHTALEWPPVTILKPVFGVDKDLDANLRSACTQDYPTYQVVLSVQRLNDPALPTLHAIQREFGSQRVTVAAADSEPIVNGRAQNLAIAVEAARHELLVISDSDMRLPPDYLRHIVRPLLDPGTGCACTLYRAAGAQTWYERLELLSLNADFTINLIFANVTGASPFCLGGSTAIRRSTLDAIGGFAALREYLVDDFELGRRVRQQGLRVVLVPYFAETIMNLRSPREWWDHQVYWDQNTWAARPFGFLATVVLKAVPCALAFAALRGFDAPGLWTLVATVGMRLATVLPMLHLIGDREGVRSGGWLPLRDIVGLGSWFLALTKRRFVWRGLEFKLARDGRIVPRQV